MALVGEIPMAENKTRSTDASVDEYLASRAKDGQVDDCRALMQLLKRITKLAPRMWGPSIVGYGSYRYTYESGRSGEAPLAGFAIRGRDLVVYLDCGDTERPLLDRLGKHTMGKSCLYLRHLADVDVSVLEQLLVSSIANLRSRYG
jgi:hypothetical protein